MPRIADIEGQLEDCFVTLREKLMELGSVAIAVSGGVDSMTLAVFAHRVMKPNVEILHATSPAVPPEGTERVLRYAEREGWKLRVFDAGEFDDPDYLQNPSNRCYFCKSNLYKTIRRQAHGTILSGTNSSPFPCVLDNGPVGPRQYGRAVRVR